MTYLRSKLTYANVVATLALCIAVGGASAFAANQLAKNSVGTKQLKKNAVTTAKIKNRAVTGAKLKTATIGTVPSAQVANTLAAPEPWHEVGKPGEPSFLNGWDHYPGSPLVAFYRDAGGVVHLRGAVTGANEETAAFFLPAGFRPAATQSFASWGGPQALIVIPASGEVRPYCGTGGVCATGLEGISFRAEG
ncbi:MAG TPA: hypothetical protein VFB52_03780 [Solirubrobacterales bacterium]|nr:hypothetical protein [Solirubrobacterales bacterium]